jgi:hypothetical protein
MRLLCVIRTSFDRGNRIAPASLIVMATTNHRVAATHLARRQTTQAVTEDSYRYCRISLRYLPAVKPSNPVTDETALLGLVDPNRRHGGVLGAGGQDGLLRSLGFLPRRDGQGVALGGYLLLWWRALLRNWRPPSGRPSPPRLVFCPRFPAPKEMGWMTTFLRGNFLEGRFRANGEDQHVIAHR